MSLAAAAANAGKSAAGIGKSAAQKGKKIGSILGTLGGGSYVLKNAKDVFSNSAKEAAQETGKTISKNKTLAVGCALVAGVIGGAALIGRAIGGAIGKAVDKHNNK